MEAEMWLFRRDSRRKNQHSKKPLECGVYWFVLLQYARAEHKENHLSVQKRKH